MIRRSFLQVRLPPAVPTTEAVKKPAFTPEQQAAYAVVANFKPASFAFDTGVWPQAPQISGIQSLTFTAARLWRSPRPIECVVAGESGWYVWQLKIPTIEEYFADSEYGSFGYTVSLVHVCGVDSLAVGGSDDLG